MASFKFFWLSFVFIVQQMSFYHQVDGAVINIYSSTKPGTLLANLSRAGWTNYSLQMSREEESSFIQRLSVSVDLSDGLVRMAHKPNCKKLQLNPFTLFVEKTSIYRPTKRSLSPLTVTVIEENCALKFRGRLKCTPLIGSRVFYLRHIFTHLRGLKLDPTSMRLGNKFSRKYFRIGAKSNYLILRRSLLKVQKRTLEIELLFPATYSEGNKQSLVVRIELIIDCKHDVVKKVLRFRRRIHLYAPRFSSSHLTALISEDSSVGSSVSTVNARDTNDGRAGKIVYRMAATQNLDSQSYFTMDRDTGLITTLNTLDREKMPAHFFRVTAEYEQHRSLYAEADLTINVDDVNDNAPAFEASSYSKVIPEDLYVGDTVIDVRARDSDAGQNAVIRYSIVNRAGVNRAFQIGESSGEITIDEPLDREKVGQYSLTLQASDQGSPPKTGQATVRITVTDVNDCTPQFSKREYTTSVREDIKPGQLVLTVSASDQDLGINREITYSFSSGNDLGLFSINRLNGQIKVSKPLDFEYAPVHTLFVMAQDKGETPLYNETSVEILLVDVNDNAPQFASSNFLETVSERENVGHTFTRIQAFDVDYGSNQQIVYSLVETGLPFGIDSQTGDLYLTQKLDRETVDRYVFHVKAEDKGVPPKSSQAKVTVTVGDINDNPPKFSKPVYFGSVEEKARFGTAVLQVSATDPDLGQSNIIYTLESADSSQRPCFRISGTGAITLSCRLDYSKTKFYSLVVKARDSRLVGSAIVRINVTDSNTHKPIFLRRIYQQQINEATKVGGRVLVVKATDNDEGLNAKLTYAFEQSQQDFSINSNTGEITVARSLDRETTPQYRLVISATDHGNPRLKGTAKVHVTVTDVNDNKPRFLESSYAKSILENVPPGTKVLEVSAVDDDDGSNKAITYSFAADGDGKGAFQIDSTQGVIRTKSRLDRETVPEYELTVIASDKGRPPLSSSVKVKITLGDVRDSKPKFEKDPYIVLIREDLKERSDVLQVKAVSQDLVQGNPIIYSIISGNDPPTFGIRTNGLIQTRTKLDYETRSQYILRVRATSSPYFVETIVNITLIDVNDNLPVLQNFFMVINVLDNKFPTQPKFKIPAYDPDVSDRLVYEIESVTQGDWVILNRTTGYLELSSTLTNTRKPLTMVVHVSDGVNSARANGQIMVTSVTTAMLNNSVTLDIYDATIGGFLDSSYEKLVRAISDVLNCNLDQVAVFNIDSKDIKATSPLYDDISQLKIWLAVYRLDSSRNRFGFYKAEYVRDMIYINMLEISMKAEVKLLPFEDSLCVQEICNDPQPGSLRSCLSYLEHTSKSITYNSSKIVFRTVGAQESYRCPCAENYQGEQCDKEVNLCYSNPCMGNGKCVSVEGNYSCICNPGRTGQNCEIDFLQSKCPSDSKASGSPLKANPCRNGGTCKDAGSGFTCKCHADAEVDKPLCELSTRSFKKGSFIAFPALKQRWRVHIQLEFATIEHSGLLLFNGRHNGKHDFISILVIKGQVQLIFSIFSQTITVTTNVNGGVADGRWHKVEVSFHKRTGILIVDDCKPAVALRFGTQVGSFSCAAAKRVIPNVKTDGYRSLDLTGPLLMGGILPLPLSFPIPYKNFTGCIKNVYIDHKFLDLRKPLHNNGTTAKCPQMTGSCSSNPCKRGKCVDLLGTYLCECPSSFGGRSCDTEMTFTQFFSGQSFKRLGYKTKVTLTWRVSMRFRTSRPSGTLLDLTFKSSSSLLQIAEGKISYDYNDLPTIQVPHIQVNDSRWHHVEVLWTYTSVVVTVDYIYQVSVPSSHGSDLVEAKQFFFGARKNSTSSAVYGGFRGCLQGVYVESGEVNMNKGVDQNVKVGCIDQVPSPCLSNPCPVNSTCQEQFDSYKCLCPPGFVGRHCHDICLLKPCQHGLCVQNSSTAKGFYCLCPRQYTGEFCEVRLQTPCKDGWFGSPSIGICGPCMCDVGVHLNPVCNRTTGECYCKPKHYRKILSTKYSKGSQKSPIFSEGCFSCDCEGIGSTADTCKVANGQCPCRLGRGGAKDVIGRRCDTCKDKQGEIVRGKGCVVINTSCPRAFAEGIWWNKASFGRMAVEECPFGSSGKATRFCDKDDGWHNPSLLSCVSNSFLALQKKLSNLTSGVVNWEPAFAIDLAIKMDLAITLSPRLFARDIEIALKIMTTLFDYESQQNSSTLVSAQTKEFAKVLLQSASMLFSSDNKDVWDHVQEYSAGTAALLQQMENFCGNLASALPYLKRDSQRYRRSTDNILPPYTILTPNIVMDLQPVFVNGFSGLSYPETPDVYGDGPYRIWRNISNRIDIPSDFFQSALGIKNSLGIGFMIIQNIGDLLPKSFDAKIRDTKYKVEVSSDVISVKLPEMQSAPLDSPIDISFANRLVNRSSYICVHWNYSIPNTRGGGWSRDGCKLKSSNVTHTVCACTHMTAFAVLSDLNLQYPEVAAFSMRLVTYVGMSVSLFLLLVAFILFLLMRKLKSNSISIHKNLIAVIFLAELTFLIGINQTADQRICRLVAICLHYFFCASFSWMFVEGLHMYRRLREKRNVDTGKMSFYYFMGWGCPAIVVGISAGLASDGYGNEKFCWMSTDGTLIWTFTIPIIIVVALNAFIFIMALGISLRKQSKKKRRRHHHHHDIEHSNLNAALLGTAGLLPLIGVSFAFGLLLVNQELDKFHYIFAGFSFSQGLFIFVFYLVLDKRVRKEFKNVYMRWKTGDKTYGLNKPTQNFTRSYHPGEMAPLRTPYDFDDEGNATSTSTTEPSSSGFRSSMTSRYTTEDGASTLGDDTSVPEGDLPKAKYPDNPELERARKIWEQPEKSEASTTQPESSSEDEEGRPSSRGIASESSDSEDDQVPSENGWPKGKTPKKRRKAPFYASDGPMHSTPMETTPDEEPVVAEAELESSDTGDEDIPTIVRKKEHPSFKAAPEIIQDKGVSGSAATSDTAPSVESSLAKKPLKSALKKPKNPLPPPVVLNDENDDVDSPDKPLNPSDHHHHHHHHHHKHKERPRSRASSGSTDYKEKKRRFRKKSWKKKETVVQVGREEYRVKLGDPTDFQDSQV